MLHIFRNSFPKDTSGRRLSELYFFVVFYRDMTKASGFLRLLSHVVLVFEGGLKTETQFLWQIYNSFISINSICQVDWCAFQNKISSIIRSDILLSDTELKRIYKLIFTVTSQRWCEISLSNTLIFLVFLGNMTWMFQMEMKFFLLVNWKPFYLIVLMVW